MSYTVTVPEGVEYVGAALLSTTILLLGQNVVVSRFRRRAGIKYPQLYAEKAEQEANRDALLFNCAQRAHQNTLENLPILYVTTLLSAVKYPIFAASTCLLFVIGRVAYTKGYVSGEPSQRVGTLYRLGAISQVAQLLASIYIAGGWVLSGLSSKFSK